MRKLVFIIIAMVLGGSCAEAATFSDIKNHWAEKEIYIASSGNIVNGYPDGTFKPNNPVTRAEFIKMVDRAYGLGLEHGEVQSRFWDTKGHWAERIINNAVAKGVANGYPDGSFKPNASITREEAAAILHRQFSAGNLDPWLASTFKDYDRTSGWAKESVVVLVNAGLMQGTQGRYLNPRQKITRSESIVLALRGSGKVSTPSPNYPPQSFVANLKVAKETNQIIAVVGKGGSKASVSLHQKGSNGFWSETLSVNGIVGKNGIGLNKREGDYRTPEGVYSLGTAFGIAGNPGTKVPYRQVTKYDYWVDDPNSTYYNQWVNTLEIQKDWKSAEHLMSYPVQYKYATAINYNTDRIPNNGSAIFLHVANGSYTAGCIAVPENVMIQLLKDLQSDARIVIVPSESALRQY